MPKVSSLGDWNLSVAPPQEAIGGIFQIKSPMTGVFSGFQQQIHGISAEVTQAFNQLDAVAQQTESLGYVLNNIDQQATLNQQQIQFANQLMELKTKYANRSDWHNMEEDFKNDSIKLINNFGHGLRGEFADKFRMSVLTDITNAAAGVKQHSRNGRINTFKASLILAEDYHSRRAAEGNNEEAIVHNKEYEQKIVAALSLGVINEVDAQTKMQQFREKVSLIKAEQLISLDPGRAYITMKDPTQFTDLDPLKREKVKEKALAHLRQEILAEQRAERQAELQYKKQIRKNGARVSALAASGQTNLQELRHLLTNDRISVTDYSHAERLLKEHAKGDIITDQNAMLLMHHNILQDNIDKTDIIEATNISPDDKRKLLDKLEVHKKSGDLSNKPDYKNDVKIIEANVKVKGFMGAIDPKYIQAYANAVTHYDRRRRSGAPREVALTESINYYKRDTGSDSMPLLMYGTVNDNLQDLASKLKQRLNDKTIPIEIYNDEMIKLVQVKRIKEAQALKQRESQQQFMQPKESSTTKKE